MESLRSVQSTGSGAAVKTALAPTSDISPYRGTGSRNGATNRGACVETHRLRVTLREMQKVLLRGAECVSGVQVSRARRACCRSRLSSASIDAR